MCNLTAGDDNDNRNDKPNAGRDPRLLVWPEDEGNSKPVRIGSLCNPLTFLQTKWRYWTFAYMNVVLDKGAEAAQQRRKNNNNDNNIHYLTSDDLYVVPKAMESKNLVDVFDQHYHAHHEENAKDNITDPTFSNHSLKASRRRLLWALWKVGAPTFIPAGFCQLVVVICGTALPLLVRELLKVLEQQGVDGQSILQTGLPLAIAIFAVSVFNGFGNHRQRHLAMKTGVALRAAVVNELYQHVLRLSPSGKKGLTSGEVANLFAVDAQKLFEVTQEGHLIWSLPLSICLVTFFLYRTLGPSTLVGIVVLVGFVPLIQKVTSQMLAIRQQRVMYTDRRVDIVSNMLQGIKVTKLNNYEGT
jgi:ABC-type bacteriocin/lantibiotic exporter with double-glycine peptidase domain